MGVLKGTRSFYQYSISDEIAYNVQQWLEYGLIENGAYTNIGFDTNASGYATLKRSYDPSLGNAGRVYEGIGPSWVWQSGVSVPTGRTAPYRASGVVVDGTFYSVNSAGAYAHTIDFANGRVVFDTAIDATSVVKCQHVINDVGIYLSNSPQWKTIIDQYVTKFDILDTLQPSGISSILKSNRVWLPCIVVDVQERTQQGLQLGGGLSQSFAIFYHVFADNPGTNSALFDLLNDQQDKRLDFFNANTAPFPLDSTGAVSSGLKYNELAVPGGTYFLTYGYINSSKGGFVGRGGDVFRGEVRQSILVDRYLSTI